MRARADEGHAALKHVQQLRQLIDTEAAKKSSGGRDTRVVARGGFSGADVAHVGVHRAELEDVDRLVVESDARLHEEHRPRTAEAHEQRGNEQDRREEG